MSLRSCCCCCSSVYVGGPTEPAPSGTYIQGRSPPTPPSAAKGRLKLLVHKALSIATLIITVVQPACVIQVLCCYMIACFYLICY